MQQQTGNPVRGSLLVLVMAGPFSMQVFATETMSYVTTVQIVDAPQRLNRRSYKRIGYMEEYAFA